MVIFQLMGGLGNQMFAYAAARAFSAHTGLAVKFDFDCPYKHIQYTYALDIFNVNATMASDREKRASKPKRGIERRLYMLLGKNTAPHLAREKKEFTYDESFFQIPDGSYVSGFWQTEKYFLPIADEVRRHFTFLQKPSAENADALKRIRESNSIAIHIRRGDYVNVPKTNAHHGLCSIDYYHSAIEELALQTSDPELFFFSNDIPWVKENIRTRYKQHYIDHNIGSQSFEDMRLMSNCHHAVIANSSFSWWGAWLNANPVKKIVAPERWMNNEQIATPDIIPSTWIKVRG